MPVLLERIWYEMIGGEYLEILRPPIRQPRNRLAQNKEEALTRAVELAAKRLQHSRQEMNDPELILVVIDADQDPACQLGPKMRDIAQEARRDQNISCVLAVVEFESWFVAGAASLAEYLNLDQDGILPEDPEGQRLGKGWIEKRFQGVKYSETIDQTKLTAKMDLKICRNRSPSFDKLCRELEKAASRAA